MFRYSDIARGIVRERQAAKLMKRVEAVESEVAQAAQQHQLSEEEAQALFHQRLRQEQQKKPLRLIDPHPSFGEARRTLVETPGILDHRLEQAGRGAKVVGRVVSPVARGGVNLARRVGGEGLKKIKQVVPKRQPQELPQPVIEPVESLPIQMHEVAGGAILRINDPQLKEEIGRKIRPEKAAFRGNILMQVGSTGDYLPFSPDEAKALAGAFSSLEVQPKRPLVEQSVAEVPPIIGRDVAGGVELIINNPKIQQVLRQKINPDTLTLRGNVLMAKEQGQPRPLTVNESIRLRREINTMLQGL